MVDALSATVRALGFIALFQAAGIATFVAIFGGHLVATLASTRRIGIASAIVAALLVAIHLLLEPARMGGELAGALDQELRSLVWHSSITTAAALRVAGLALIIAGLHGFARRHGAGSQGAESQGSESRAWRRADARSRETVTRRWHSARSLLFHIRWAHVERIAAEPTLQALLVLHLVVVTFWFGALVPLYRASAGESPSVAGAATEAFSQLAIRVVPILLIAGVALAVLLMPSLDALWATTYGQLLIVKIVAFAALMLLGALNKWRLGPALTRGDPGAAALFRRSLALEYVLISAALSVTAVLTSFYSPH